MALSEAGKTPLSNIFIDKYMIKANASFVKVYIYGYKYDYLDKSLNSKQISEALNILESDVILAWKYWQNEGILNLNYDSISNVYTVKYLDIDSKLDLNYTSKEKPHYSPKEINELICSNENTKELVNYIQTNFNKLLTHRDIETIVDFYCWLHLPVDVIKLLLSTYCDKNLSFIEKIAIEWNQNGIDTVAKANEFIKTKQTKSGTKSRFINYNQSEWNFDELESLERQYIDKNLER